MTEQEIRDEHELILAGLSQHERDAVWRRCLFGRRVDVRLLPVAERLQELRRKVAANTKATRT